MRLDHLVAIMALGVTSACAAHVATTPAPTPTPGARVRYAARYDPGRFATVRLVFLDPDSLVFERFDPGVSGQEGRWVVGSLTTDSLAHLQVRTGRRGNAARGALIGGGAGLALGLLCAASIDEDQWFQPTPGECLASGVLSGAGFGLLIGALVRSDVWSPVVLPTRPGEPLPEASPVTTARTAVGIRVPLRISR